MFDLSLTSFMLFPLCVLFVYSCLNVTLGIKGRFTPWQTLVRAVGGAVFILGFGMTGVLRMELTPLNGSIMIWALMIMVIPRLHFMAQQLHFSEEEKDEFEKRTYEIRQAAAEVARVNKEARRR